MAKKRKKLVRRAKPRALHTYLEIDKTNLDAELLTQSQLYHQAGLQVVAKQRLFEEAEQHLSLVKNRLEGKKREELLEEQAKATVAEVDSRVKIDSRYRKANAAWREARLAVEEAKALRAAFEQRSHTLRELVQLYTAQYFQTNEGS